MAAAEGQHAQRVIFVLPPGASVTMAAGEPAVGTLPVWLYWLNLAEHFADEAVALREGDTYLGGVADRLDGRDRSPLPERESGPLNETKASMLAITCSAHAVDGFYGSVKPLIGPPRSRAARPRQVLETLKLGFAVGALATQWLVDLDWLFRLRDGIVHHAEVSKQLKVARVTARGTSIVGSAELFDLSADSAVRAAAIVRAILERCIESAKPALKDWVEKLGELSAKLE